MQDKIQPYLNKLLEFIQRKRINSNISLDELEKKCNEAGLKIKSGTLSKIEKGEVIPNTDTLFTILHALDCKIEIDNKYL